MTAVNISSASQFNQLLSSTTIVVTDFYADWCGPCKQIAPTYEKLSSKFSKPKVVTFTKVNVDNQQEISRKYGVSAMPTFMIFRNSTVIETIRGADPRKLTQAIENAVRNAGPAKPAYSSVGRTLGGTPPANGTSMARPLNIKGFVQAVIAFIGLYLVSLFSLDAYSAAEKSPFNIHRVEAPAPSAPNTKRTGAATAVGKKLGTISDLS